MSMHRNNPIIQSWRVKAGSDLLSGTTTLAVEKVFLAEATSTSAKVNDIALVKLRSPVHVTGETWHAPPRSKISRRQSSTCKQCPTQGAAESGCLDSGVAPASLPRHLHLRFPLQTEASPSVCPILMRSWHLAHPCG